MNNPKNQQIPHIIHYFWFGSGQKPESVQSCIASWRKFCPDFEIKEWNESNYDIHKHPYMEKAYKDKKWAFVSDYARLDILYQYGGIYLDTDVEVIKNLGPLCEYKGYIGFENTDFVNDGQGFGGAKGFPLFKEMLDIYDTDEAFDFWGGEKHNVESPKLRTKVLLRHGLCQDGSRQTVQDMEVFPSEYFCPKDYETGRLKITDNTYSIHHYDGSWHEGNAQRYVRMRQKLNRTFGKKLGKVLFNTLIWTKDSVKKLIGR